MMSRVELDGVGYDLPQTWDDIPASRLPRLLEQVYLVPESGRMYHELIKLSLGISDKVWRKLHKRHFGPRLTDDVRRKNAEVLQQLVGELAWLWEEPMTRPPFSELSLPGQLAMVLPDEGFTTMGFGELTDLYTHLETYTRQNESERLDYLVATVLRPRRRDNYLNQPDWNGDVREPYNEFLARERVPLVAKLPFPTKLNILLFVAANIKTVMGRYQLFDRTETQGADAGETYPGQAFIKNQHMLAEKGIFGNLRQTQAANCHEVLLFLEEHRADLVRAHERQQQHERNG